MATSDPRLALMNIAYLASEIRRSREDGFNPAPFLPEGMEGVGAGSRNIGQQAVRELKSFWQYFSHVGGEGGTPPIYEDPIGDYKVRYGLRAADSDQGLGWDGKVKPEPPTNGGEFELLGPNGKPVDLRSEPHASRVCELAEQLRVAVQQLKPALEEHRHPGERETQRERPAPPAGAPALSSLEESATAGSMSLADEGPASFEH